MINFERYDRLAIVHLDRKLTIDIINDIKAVVTEALESGFDNVDIVALDFGEIESIDSCGISFLVDLLKNTRGSDIRLIFYNLSRSLKKLFSSGGLDSFFTIVSEEKFTEMIY